MKVYIVIKSSDKPNPYDEPGRELVEIDCIKATLDGALERIKELTNGSKYNNEIGYRESWLT